MLELPANMNLIMSVTSQKIRKKENRWKYVSIWGEDEWMYEQINGQMVTWIKGVCTKAVPLKWYFLMEHSIESIFLHRSFIMSLQHVPLSLHIVFWLANEFKFSMCWILFVPCLLHSYPGCSLIASLALPDIGVWVARRGAQGRGVFNCHIQGGGVGVTSYRSY